MPTFDTRGPVAADVEIALGDVRIVASDRDDTVVDVRPSDPTNPADVRAAEQTRIDFANGTLTVKGPHWTRQYVLRRRDGSIDVQIDLPVRSHVRGDAGAAAFRCSGRLGDCRFRAGHGDIQLDEADALDVKSGRGDVDVARVHGDVSITSASGSVRVGVVGGSASIKNANGSTWIGEAGSDLRVTGANGPIVVDAAGATIVAKTAHGDVRLRQLAGGATVVQTALGDVEIGVLDGVPAWLDLHTTFGTVRNGLAAGPRPGPGEKAVEVRARTSRGDIRISRSSSRAARQQGA